MPRHASHILELARRGAEHRLAELQAEITALKKAFPDLAVRTGKAVADTIAPAEVAMARAMSRRRRRMSAAQRKAVSQRMRA
jgi:hypothetical protein